MNYDEFINSKTQLAGNFGFEPIELPKCLFDFQAALVEWAIRKGKAAIFADCGLGKSLMQLVWADNVVRKTNLPVLILTPIAVGIQTVAEAEKFGIPNVIRSRDGVVTSGARIIVTNYEQLHHFKADDFAGVVCDESSILKNFDGARKTEITAFMRTRKYRLLCTATAAPNDYIELGTSSEALGELGYMDMLGRFFKANNGSLHAFHAGHPRRISGEAFRFRGHAEHDFWRWVCSWARAVRKPSDLGFSNDKFVLPPITYDEFKVVPNSPAPGFLFEMPCRGLKEQRQERRRTIAERCEMAASRVNDTAPAICWCHLNDEGDLLEESIKDCVQVSGKDSDDEKENKIAEFIKGNVRVLVSKGSVAGFGLNLQHCAHQTFFPSHSFEQFYQCVRRCWRFGQTKPVQIDIITSEAEAGILSNLKAKSDKSDRQFEQLTALMNDHLKIEKDNYGNKQLEAIPWLK